MKRVLISCYFLPVTLNIMYCIRIGSQNVQGAFRDKCSDEEFVDILDRFDILGVQETKLTNSHSLSIPGYSYFRNDKNKGKYAFCTRGIAAIFKNELKRGLTKC